MIRPGLVSVTFRALSPAEIIELACRSGMACIMWGGDVHAPAGDIALARNIAEQTLEAGLSIESYGSYYRAGDSGDSFERELETALALKAPRIRVWAGAIASHSADHRRREKIVDDLRWCVALAREAQVTVALEFHADTLADTAESAAALMREVHGARLSWQPPNGMACAPAAEGLRKVLPWVDTIHVFHWRIEGESQIRLPLADGADAWQTYLQILAEAPAERYALMEFVRDDSPAQFAEDATHLRRWLAV